MIDRDIKVNLNNGSEINNSNKTMNRPSLGSVILIVLVILLAVILLIVGIQKGWFSSLLGGDANYQAVFLDNGLLYFCKVNGASAKYLVMRDVYYFVQPSGATQPQLVKFGAQEIHGPKDHIKINQSKVLMIQDLRDDSLVTQAIVAFKNQGK